MGDDGGSEKVEIGVVLLLCAAPLIWLALVVWRRRALRRLFSRPFPAEWTALLEAKVPLFRVLPEAIRQELKGHINVFLAKKLFEGCGGLEEVTDEMRLVVASQACLLLLSGRSDCYPGLTSILIYPGAYVVREKRRQGYLETDSDSIRSGESWQQGALVLSWEDVLVSMRYPDDGYNIVLHEFAHQMEGENGPVTESATFEKEYKSLKRAMNRGEETVFDYYGATDRAEFFAVATEAFFEMPHDVKAEHRGLYSELAAFYGLDPASWQSYQPGRDRGSKGAGATSPPS